MKLVKAKIAIAAIKIGRRPKRSDSGPYSRYSADPARKYRLTVSFTISGEALRISATCGWIGAYRSVASVARVLVAINAATATMRPETPPCDWDEGACCMLFTASNDCARKRRDARKG